MKLLIVDDDKDIRRLIRLCLEAEGFEIVEAECGETALSVINPDIDLVILDMMMPRKDGIETCRELRAKGYMMPVLFLTAKGDDIDKLLAFSSGGDDYITKPFQPLDLTTRVKSSIRRYRQYVPAASVSKLVKLGAISVDFDGHSVTKNEMPIHLTRKEFGILSLLLRSRGRVFSAEQIYTSVWDEMSILNAESTISVHMRNLREKIEDDPAKPQLIKTVWGVGYRVD